MRNLRRAASSDVRERHARTALSRGARTLRTIDAFEFLRVRRNKQDEGSRLRPPGRAVAGGSKVFVGVEPARAYRKWSDRVRPEKPATATTAIQHGRPRLSSRVGYCRSVTQRSAAASVSSNPTRASFGTCSRQPLRRSVRYARSALLQRANVDPVPRFFRYYPRCSAGSFGVTRVRPNRSRRPKRRSDPVIMVRRSPVHDDRTAVSHLQQQSSADSR